MMANTSRMRNTKVLACAASQPTSNSASPLMSSGSEGQIAVKNPTVMEAKHPSLTSALRASINRRLL